ncbi:MAG: helix-turn-helix domain-containing protein [Lactobacillus crispatus]|nr:helix-turn-helix domain-containing protein [Lactobacillus crispatus]
MKIGEALRKERLKLGLTQEQMCEGILSRPFYAKVESDKNRINAESLFKILLEHQVDLVEFCDLIQDDYTLEERKVEKQFEFKMNLAVSAKDTEALDKYCQQIMNSSNNEVLKLRALITSAYFKGETDKIDVEIRTKIKAEFDGGNNWLERPDLLRLLANTMPMWPQDELDFLIGRLLDFAKKSELSELTTKRYLRLLENYLVVCYDRKVHKKTTHFDHIDDAMEYIIDATESFHLMIYRIEVFYMKALFLDQMDKAKEIRQDLGVLGYKNFIASWPE